MSRSIAWVTPFSIGSDVSAFSRNILSQFHATAKDLDVSTSILINENGPSYWSNLPQIPLSGTSIDAEMLAAFDFCVFNIGNNHENHGNINRLALMIPGIAIVHDVAMQHYFADYLFERKKRKDIYAEIMAEYYGNDGLEAVSLSQICSMLGEPVYAPWDTQHVSSFPIIEPFARTAAALVVHSVFAETLVRPLTTTPVLRLQLPWDQKPYLSEQELNDWHRETRSDKIRSIIYFGHIGRPKCIDLVIEAFGRSPTLREKARFIIAGYPGDKQYVDELQSLVSALDVQSQVTFEFSVSDERLLLLKREADIFVNLRFPNAEAASGSLIEQMNAGKPVLIYSTGSFADVAGDSAVSVPREGGVQSIVDALERLISEPEERIAIGARGLQSVRRMGRNEYVARLWEFMLENEDLLRERKARSTGRRVSVISSADAAGDGRWLRDVKDVRRLIRIADTSRYVIDVRILERWSPQVRASFIATGLFGQPRHSTLESVVFQLVSAEPPVKVLNALLKAHAVWLALRGPRESAVKIEPLLSMPMLDPPTWAILIALGSEVFANSCYIFLLGRMPYAGEVEKCAADVACTPPASILHGFLSSREFNARRVASADLTQLENWMQEAEQREMAFPKLPLGGMTTLGFGTPEVRAYLVRGWHEPECDGAWSSAACSSIRFRCKGRSSDGGAMTFSVWGRLAMPTLGKDRNLKIWCNGALVYTATVVDETWFLAEAKIRYTGGQEENFLIEFDCGQTINFAALGQGPDTRELGFLLGEIRVHESL